MRGSKRSTSYKANPKNIAKGRIALALTATTLVFCAGIALLVRANNRPTASLSRGSNPSVEAVAQPNPPSASQKPNPTPGRIEGEIITITRGGFEPAEITRPKGRFAVFVENRSGLEGVTLRLDRVAGNRLRDVNVRRDKLDWDDVLDLTPGQYLMTEAGHADWVCTITITPN